MTSRRTMLLRPLLFCLLLTACVLVPQTSSLAQDPPRPNVIYIMLDDAGYGDFSCYGQKHFQTPAIDRLASEGLRFTNHYSGSTVCAPTRCSLMTGLHTGHAWVRGNREVKPEGQTPMPAEIVTIPRLLRDAGYVTGMFGKWGLGAPGSSSDPMEHFDRFYGYNCQREAHTYYPSHLWDDRTRIEFKQPVYSHDLIMDAAFHFIRNNSQGGRDKPFFCYLPVTIPHAAMHVPEEDAAPFREVFAQFEDRIGRYRGPEVKNPAAAFAGMMTRLDRHIGELTTLLDELGIADNTLVMVTSDNGPHKEGGHMPDFFNSSGSLRGHKRDLYEGGIRTPLICRWPGHITPGTVTDHLSAHWDVLPTLCQLAGADIPEGLDGVSMVPVLTGHDSQQRKHEFLYWEFHEQGGRQAVRMGQWKAVRLNVRKKADGPIELYDLTADPQEVTNIADNHPDLVRRMGELMDQSHTPSDVFTLLPAEQQPANENTASN